MLPPCERRWIVCWKTQFKRSERSGWQRRMTWERFGQPMGLISLEWYDSEKNWNDSAENSVRLPSPNCTDLQSFVQIKIQAKMSFKLITIWLACAHPDWLEFSDPVSWRRCHYACRLLLCLNLTHTQYPHTYSHTKVWWCQHTCAQIDANSAFYHMMSRNKKNKTRHELSVRGNASVHSMTRLQYNTVQ